MAKEANKPDNEKNDPKAETAPSAVNKSQNVSNDASGSTDQNASAKEQVDAANAQAKQRTAPQIQISDTPFDETDALAPVNLGAERATEVAKEIGESSGDPIRDAKLMQEHGSLYDPATSAKDLGRPTPRVGVNAEKVLSERTQREMQAGRDRLAGRRSNVVEKASPVEDRNVRIQRENKVAEDFKRPGQSYPAGSR